MNAKAQRLHGKTDFFSKITIFRGDFLLFSPLGKGFGQQEIAAFFGKKTNTFGSTGTIGQKMAFQKPLKIQRPVKMMRFQRLPQIMDFSKQA